MNDSKVESDIIAPAVKREIIRGEIQMYVNTRYQTELRHRVQKAIGGKPEVLKALEDDLVNFEAALDILGKELEAVT